MIKKLQYTLKSTRFWSVVIIAIVGYLAKEAIITNELAELVYTILGGYVGLATINKFRTDIK